MSEPAKRPSPCGVISSSEVYTTREFRKRCGLGDHAWRQLKASGFPVVEVGRKQFVMGSSFLTYLETVAKK